MVIICSKHRPYYTSTITPSRYYYLLVVTHSTEPGDRQSPICDWRNGSDHESTGSGTKVWRRQNAKNLSGCQSIRHGLSYS